MIATQSPMNEHTSASFGGNQFDGSLSPLARFDAVDTARKVRESLRSFA